MRVVIDGLPVRGQSLAIVIDNLLRGWAELGEDDLHLVTTRCAEITVPGSVTTHYLPVGRRHAVSRLRGQAVDVPRICREIGADVLLGSLPATTVTPLPCPRAIIVYDVRYELRPEQYSAANRLVRKYSYEVGYRQADAVICISDRSRQDLLASRPWLRGRPVTVAHLGADQVDGWPARRPEAEPYALAFGQYGNKNAAMVVEAWARLVAAGDVSMKLTIVGLGSSYRNEVQALIDLHGIGGHVTAMPWLSDGDFQAHFSSASLVVFPSDFEGFGMPAVEAMRLGVPVVITPEKALLEVSGGHAVVMDGWDANSLATAVRRAARRSPAQTLAASNYAHDFTWRRTAADVRATLAQATREPQRAVNRQPRLGRSIDQ